MLDFHKEGKYCRYTVMGEVNRRLLTKRLKSGAKLVFHASIAFGLTIIPLVLFPFL